MSRSFKNFRPAVWFVAFILIAISVLYFIVESKSLQKTSQASDGQSAQETDSTPTKAPQRPDKRKRFSERLLTFRDDGNARVLKVSLDEVALRDADGKERITPLIPPATDFKNLSERLGKMSAPMGVLPVAYLEGEKGSPSARRFVTSEIRAKMPQERAEQLARAHGLTIKSRPAYAPEWVIFSAKQPLDALEKIDDIREEIGVESADVLLAVLHAKRALPNDARIGQQWHLKASGTAAIGTDVNIEDVWRYGLTGGRRGNGVRIGIIDDGLQTTHPDLVTNVDTVNDKDWNGNDNDPNPGTDDDHGTSCAGVAAARGNNSIGVSGTAPEATLVGMRLIAAAVTDEQEAEAMTYLPDLIPIKSNSWGPDDTGKALEAPGSLTQTAFATATTSGRGGKGSILVWAAGNGGDTSTKDNSNYDGYANSIYTIAIGATDSLGRRAEYSEPGANVVICAPSSGAGSALDIVTTDRTGTAGYNTATTANGGDYALDFGGTSSATPAAAGIIALMLQANPNLGWRDVQEILIRSAKKISPSDPDWITNGAGFPFNHNFGAGLIDATAAVNLASGWTNLSTQQLVSSAQTGLSALIPNNSTTGTTRSFSLPSSNIRVEQVTVRLSITHARRGELEISLTSPSGTTSRLAEVRSDINANYSNWTFSSVRNWGEVSSGTWTLKVADRSSTNSILGTVTAAELNLYGTSLSAVNPAPIVRITSPLTGSQSSLDVPLAVTVTAEDFDASGASSTVSKVELYSGTTLIGTKINSPYTFSFVPPSGSITLVAKATDSESKVGSSAPVIVTVLNQSPTISAVALNGEPQLFADTALSVASVSAEDPENSALTYSYQWRFSTDETNYTDQTGAVAATLPISPTNSGKLWVCVVRADDGNSSSEPFTSAPVNILARPLTSVATGASYTYQSGLVLAGTSTELNRNAIIHEFSQGPSGGSSEWIEFLVLKQSSLRYWDFQDASGALVVFSDTAVWDDIPAGTLIVVYNGSATKDSLLPANSTNAASGKMVISSTNTTYFETGFNSWTPLRNSGDAIILSDEDGNIVHSVSYGNSTDATPNVGSVGSAKAAYYTGNTDVAADLSQSWSTTSATIARALPVTGTDPTVNGVTPSSGNTTSNNSFVTKLRAGTLNNPPVFSLASGSVLPTGLSLNATTGVISGTVSNQATLGNYPVTINLTNTIGGITAQSYIINLTPSGGSKFSSWISAFSLTDSTANGDSDFDLIPNLIEYKLNSFPGIFEQPSPILVERTSTEISITYSRAKNRNDVGLVAEWSTSLTSDSWQTAGITSAVLLDLPESEKIKSSLPIVQGDPKRFIRLKATAVTPP